MSNISWSSNLRIKKIIALLIIFIVAVLVVCAGISAAAVIYVLVPYGRSIADFENPVSIESYDGLTLAAELKLQDSSTHKWAIMVHSYRTDHSFMSAYGEAYYEQGYNVLLPDNRAHGASEGDFIGMGYLDVRRHFLAGGNGRLNSVISPA